MHTSPQHQPYQPQQWQPQQPGPYGAPQLPPRRGRGRRVLLVVLAVVAGLFALFVVAGIVGSKDRSVPSPSPSAVAFTERPPAGVPEATESQRDIYLAALAEIDPGLTVNTNRVMRRAYRVCDRILHPSGGKMTLAEYTVAELSGGNATIDQAQARQVIRAVKAWCPA